MTTLFARMNRRYSGFFVQTLERLEANVVLRAIQRGLLYALPLIIVGAIALCLLNFPSAALQNGLGRFIGPRYPALLETIVQGTLGIASLAVTCGIAFNMARFSNRSGRDHAVSPAMTIMIALSCYVMMLGSPDSWSTQFSLSYGLLVAIFASVMSSLIFICLASIRFFRLSFNVIGRDPSTFQVLTIMPAAILTIVLFAAGRIAFVAQFPEGDLLATLLQKHLMPEQAGGLGLGLLYSCLAQILWFFGIHGPNVLLPLLDGPLQVAMLENAQAALSHGVPPHIVTKEFLDVFSLIGGSGCTLSLILAILLKSHDPGNRRLCFLALIPALCNVNEPLLFGIPLIFNPLYFIPFLLVPLVNVLVAWLATMLELVPHVTTSVHWTTPALVSGYISTGSWAGVALQIVNLGLGLLLYLPFVRLAEEFYKKKLRRSISTLAGYANDVLPGPEGKKCLGRSGLEGYLARSLAEDLKKALEGREQLFLVYQPQINAKVNQVDGVECLLRWDHPVHGMIPPSLTVALAEDSGVVDALGTFILTMACMTYARWQPDLKQDFLISVNLSARQLDNPALINEIKDILRAAGMPAGNLEIEITESAATTPGATTIDTLYALRSLGLHVAIDDFGMGHTSLRYIKEFPINTVKIDRSLTEGTQCGVNDHIVRSIIDLGQNLNLRTVIEGIETFEQLKRFSATGCLLFQGHYFCTPLTREDCFIYLTSFGQKTTTADQASLDTIVDSATI